MIPKERPALDFPRPLATVDLAIFTVQGDQLQVLLVRRPSDAGEPFPGRWALPGGFIDVERDRSLQDCAARKLREKTGVAAPYLEQLGSWGGAQRDPRGWSATHAFFALLPAQGMVLEKGANAAEVAWVEADAATRKRLAFDHGEILAAAIARLRGKVEYTSLPAFLLAEPFTLPQLQQAYEIVLGRPVDKSAFRKRMLDAGFMDEAGTVDGPFGRPSMGYRLRDRTQAATFPRTFSPREAAPG
ncbi:MAG TPA: NUDIX domain-containing protein [Ramlibacter sp.]|nr:NUDIX domain-containing protein [Ramlibacter sp.]